ncbi:hypothetical protein KIPB_000174 [Kipferlia bialata]|uniref:Uncharacterized protein n=1 Tax=Kipferlia bialata TaxID=797122 RepID=A0A9K3CNM4_9EUKA|nr:hypothetical protein KIPB_000174 [Kipferlia bialata]|eukprot:g174.t1
MRADLERVLDLEAERQREALVAKAQFEAYTPSDTVQTQKLIERARSFDAESLSIHITRIEEYIPLAKRVAEGKVQLEEFLRQHPREKFISEDCAALGATLTSLLQEFQAAYTCLTDLVTPKPTPAPVSTATVETDPLSFVDEAPEAEVEAEVEPEEADPLSFVDEEPEAEAEPEVADPLCFVDEEPEAECEVEVVEPKVGKDTPIFSVAESKAMLEDAVELMEGVNSAFVIPLPGNMATLTLSNKRKYCQLEGHNDSVRTLFQSAGGVIDCQSAIEACKKQLEDLVTPDMQECADLIKRCEALIPVLASLAQEHRESQALLATLSTLEVVSDDTIQDEEYEAEVQEVQAKKRTLSSVERQAILNQARTIRQRVATLRTAQAERARVVHSLSRYAHLPQVAKVLRVGVAALPSEAVEDMLPVSGVGMMVKADGLRMERRVVVGEPVAEVEVKEVDPLSFIDEALEPEVEAEVVDPLAKALRSLTSAPAPAQVSEDEWSNEEESKDNNPLGGDDWGAVEEEGEEVEFDPLALL